MGTKLGGTMRHFSFILLFGGALSHRSLYMGIDVLQPPPIMPILAINLFCTITQVRVKSEWK